MNLPWDILDEFHGFSLDGGGTNVKLVYIHKDDWKEKEEREKGSYGKVRFKTFPSENLDITEMFDFIKNTAHLKKNVESPVIYGSGFGTSLIAADLKKHFGVDVQSVDEFSTFATALAYLTKHLPRKDILSSIEPTDRQTAIAQGKSTYSLCLSTRKKIAAGLSSQGSETSGPEQLISLQNLDTFDLDKPLADIKDLFPCVLLMCGSGIGSFFMTEDGRCELINIAPQGGKYWVGMGHLLTNAENYSQLMEMAEKGDHSQVDLVFADVMGFKKEGESDFYQDMMEETMTTDTRTVLAFSKITKENKASLKQEDLLRSMLNSHISNILYYGLSAARMTQAKHVFLSGGFPDHPLVQKQMFSQWMRTWCEAAGYSDRVDPVAIHFLQHGSFLGALGAFLINVDRSKWDNKQ